MADRPVFVPTTTGRDLVKEVVLGFRWSAGFAPVQKKKNIAALHAAAASRSLHPVLEVSTKSDDRLGKRLSAFSLKVRTSAHGSIPLECAFQGSKVFERGGPYIDLYGADAREAKRDARVRNSGRLIRFDFEGTIFPAEPRTAFYDWLYITALFPHREFLRRLEQYAGFSDIEFNPSKSINCQARSCALFVAMMRRGVLESAVRSPEAFVACMSRGQDPGSSHEQASGHEDRMDWEESLFG